LANIIEIRVRATDETGPTYDAAKARAAAAGDEIGAAYSDSMASRMHSDADQDAEEAASYWSDLFGREAEQGAEEAGQRAASAFTEAMNEGVEVVGAGELTQGQLNRVVNPAEGWKAAYGSGKAREAGEELRNEFEAGLSEDGPPDVMLPDGTWASSLKGDAGVVGRAVAEEFARQTEAGASDQASELGDAFKRMVDGAGGSGSPAQEKAKESGEGMGKLMVAGITAATAVGAPLILAGMGAAFVGVTALALKSNAVIANDYTTLGKTAEAAFTQAAAPAAGTLHQALQGVDATVQQLAPELKGLFANVEPDITSVASGVDAFAKGILPGMSSAIGSSQVIVSDFASSMGPLGSDVGQFFQGLTRDANTTGAGLQSLVETGGHLVSTLGGALGSAASAGGAALMGLDPIINGTLSLIQKIDSPGVVGGAGGLFAAWKLDPSISTGLTNIASKLTTFAKGSVDAEGDMSRLGSAASGLGGALSKGASVMSGPWGLAIGAGIGLATGLAGVLINAAKASDALTLSQQGLDQAAQQDNGHIGEAITTYVAAQAQADGLAQSAANAGVSLQTWTQAVIGNKAAQEEVTAYVKTANQVVQNQAAATANASHATGKFSQDLQDARQSAADGAAANNRLTDANQQLLSSMTAQNQQITQAVEKQAQLQAATNALTNATDIFAASLKSTYQSQVASAQQSALGTVASLNLGSSQTALSQKLYNTVTAYQMLTGASSAYNTILTDLNGTTMGLDEAQNTLDSQLVTAKQTFSANGASIAGNTQAAVTNRQALVSAAQAITALGVAEEQATGSVAKGNETIQQQITAFVNATGATGKARQAIISYLEQITKIPPDASTTMHVSTGSAISALNQLYNEITAVEQHGGNPIQMEVSAIKIGSGHAYGGNIGAAAGGGAQGGMTLVGEQGPEVVNLPYGTSVMPNSNFNSMFGMGGPLTVRLEVASAVGGSGLERLFISWLKGAIRAIGGSGPNSVQRALGQVA
jgi:hypothetical protein